MPRSGGGFSSAPEAVSVCEVAKSLSVVDVGVSFATTVAFCGVATRSEGKLCDSLKPCLVWIYFCDQQQQEEEAPQRQ